MKVVVYLDVNEAQDRHWVMHGARHKGIHVYTYEIANVDVTAALLN